MKQTKSLMGMSVTVEVSDRGVTKADIDHIFDYFTYIDETFSMYKRTSEIARINRGGVKPADYSDDMKTVLAIGERTKAETFGYFDMHRDNKIDPTGVVKGWAIWKAAGLLRERGFTNYFVDAGGDVQVSGVNDEGKPWTIGIRNPFIYDQVVKVVAIGDRGIATSGTSIRGQHIYNPHDPGKLLTDIISITVIGPNVCDADRFATAAFAMEAEGIRFIERLPGFEGYMIDKKGIATLTSGFDTFAISTISP